MVQRTARAAVMVGALTAIVAGCAPVVASAASYHTPGYVGTKTPIATAPAPTAVLPPVTVGSGNHPSVVVDAAGTAHIAWTTDDGNQADALHYCRLPRGTSACNNVDPVLRPEHPYVEGGDGPEVNVESGGPKLFIVGDQLVMVSHRTATYFPHPDGGASPENETTLIYTSPDGGTTWTGPAVVGTAPIQGVGTVFGTATNPTIVTISDTVTGGTFVQGISPAAFSSPSANLGSGPSQWFAGSVAVDGGLPVAAFTDGDNVFMQRWTGNGSINDASTWSPQVTLPGDTPQIAGGPSGLYLSDSESPENDVIVHKVTGSSEGAGTKISGDDPNNVRFVEGPDGRLLATWDYRGDTKTGIVLNQSAPNGSGWAADGTPIQPTQASVNELDMGVAGDGGGFVVAHEGDGTSTEASIVAVPFGSQAATHQLGVGGLTGASGGDTSATEGCKAITFQDVGLNVPIGCFTRGLGANETKDVATGTITLNGLTITPDAAAGTRSSTTRAGGTPTQIIIDPRHHTLDTTGNVTVTAQLPGGGHPVTLWHGQLHVNLAASAKTGVTLFDFPHAAFPTTVEGFKVLNDIPVKLTANNGTTIGPIELQMPAELGSITTTVTLKTTPAGLVLSSFDAMASDVMIGPLTINSFHLHYDADSDTWTANGKGSLTEPFDIQVTAAVMLKDGDFVSAAMSISYYPGWLVYEPFDLYLTGLGAHIAFNKQGVDIGGTATLGAVPVFTGRTFILGVVGGVDFQFGHPFTLTLTGDGMIVGTTVLTSKFVFSTNGTAVFTGELQLGDSVAKPRTPPPFGPTGLDANLTAGIVHKDFDGHADVTACLAGVCPPSLDLEANNKGFAVCLAGGGLTDDWTDPLDLGIELSGCDDSDYKSQATTRALGGAQTFTVPAGAPTFDVEVDGATAVDLVGPGGPIALGVATNTAAPAIALTHDGTTFIGLRKPAAGTYTVAPAAGSAPITGVATALGHGTPKVTSARVSGHGRKRTLTYRLTNAAGVKVSFVERDAQGDYALGAAKGSSGHLRFTAQNGPAGRRAIVAVATPAGASAPRQLGVVAHYTAPGPPRPGRVRHVSVRHSGSSLAIGFGSGANAVGYLIKVSLAGDVRYTRVLKANKHSARIPAIARTATGTVTVTTIAATGARVSAHARIASTHRQH